MSKNGIALLVLALSTVGVNVAEDSLVELISAIGTIVSFLLMVWNQYQRTNVSFFFWKK